ncbi:hypothetical protein PG994_009326 [Apiospora phragmitis]|uniref:Uncharacterized protein n=1 Tax=Apiospora phragmitis TaxID=2905665 RepID=A0ABR1ULU7_9PEZI
MSGFTTSKHPDTRATTAANANANANIINKNDNKNSNRINSSNNSSSSNNNNNIHNVEPTHHRAEQSISTLWLDLNGHPAPKTDTR